MPLSILGISWSFISSIYSVCVCVYIYINITSIGSGNGTVLKVSIWHRYRKKTKRYPTLITMIQNSCKLVFQPATCKQKIQGSRLRPKWSHLRPFFESVRVKIWMRSHLCECMVCAAAGERFHWSREERRFQHERFSRAWFTPVSHACL